MRRQRVVRQIEGFVSAELLLDDLDYDDLFEKASAADSEESGAIKVLFFDTWTHVPGLFNCNRRNTPELQVSDTFV